MQGLLRPRLRYPIISLRLIPISQSEPYGKPRFKGEKINSISWGKVILQMGMGTGMGGTVAPITANNYHRPTASEAAEYFLKADSLTLL